MNDDEWELSIFDVNGDHSQTIGESHGVTLKQAFLHMQAARAMWPDKQLRIVLERVK